MIHHISLHHYFYTTTSPSKEEKNNKSTLKSVMFITIEKYFMEIILNKKIGRYFF